jgi:flagellar basal-body rod protein FlgC
MSLFKTVEVAATALSAQRARMEIAAANMANAETTRTPEGGPYRRKLPVFTAEPETVFAGPFEPERIPGGVRLERIVTDSAPPLLRFEPSHPDANADGYVEFPAVNPTEEMVDLISAARSYEAGISVIRVARQLLQTTLNLVR